jgi:hypothetical protein
MDTGQMQGAADRLAVKLEALDLDDEERAVLGAMLGAGASSVDPLGGEVEGFAFDSYLGLDASGLGHDKLPSSEPIHETVALTFGQIVWTYTPQRVDRATK